MIGFVILAFFSGLFIGAGVGILAAGLSRASARQAPEVTWSGPLPSAKHGGLHIGHIAEG